jgi:hypothetical protein
LANQACAGINLLPNNTSLFKSGSVIYTWNKISPINSSLVFSDSNALNPNIFIPNNKGSFDTSYVVKLTVKSVDACIDDNVVVVDCGTDGDDCVVVSLMASLICC